VLDRLLREDRLTFHGEYYDAVDARATPGCVQQPRVPFIVAANGPRSLRLAAQYGQGWVTTGGASDDLDGWWRVVAGSVRRFDDLLGAAGRSCPLWTGISASTRPRSTALSTVDAFTDAAGRAGNWASPTAGALAAAGGLLRRVGVGPGGGSGGRSAGVQRDD
jgi:alkanesulfonate monooxygenase SsuD/methylene tetrahydromethanopterin reductase-like flavin-dependent oxidoreductase (luciferase family)